MFSQNVILNGNNSNIFRRNSLKNHNFEVFFISFIKLVVKQTDLNKNSFAFIARNLSHRSTSFATAQLLQLSKSVAKKLLSQCSS